MRQLRLAVLSAAWFFAVGMSFPVSARADIQSIRSSDSSINGSLGASLFSYQESVLPLPDSQHGWLPSLAAGLNYMTDSNTYFDVDGGVSFGTDHYNGAYFYSPTTPLQGTTHETISNVDGKIGQGFPLGTMVMLIPYGDLGFRYWDRNLGNSQVEDYQNFDFLGGVMLQVSPIRRLVLTGYGAAGSTFAAQMKTSGDTYDLGSAGIYKLGGKVGFDVTSRVEVFTTLDYDHFRFGQSSVVDGAYEPGSGTEDTTWRVGLAYHFK